MSGLHQDDGRKNKVKLTECRYPLQGCQGAIGMNWMRQEKRGGGARVPGMSDWVDGGTVYTNGGYRIDAEAEMFESLSFRCQ